MASDRTAIHLLAGGVAGTTGAVLTCPLEVVKTRLQSSHNNFAAAGTTTTTPPPPSSSTPPSSSSKPPGGPKPPPGGGGGGTTIFRPVTSASFGTLSNGVAPAGTASATQATVASASTSATAAGGPPRIGLLHCLKHIVQHEGTRGLFKGLGPNLIGVAPSRAIYFWAYANAKKTLNSTLSPNTPIVHICSAACAGFTASTCTNPIWFIKTRIQLDQHRSTKGRSNAWRITKDIFQQHGIRGFYKGITASYYGISETVIHFVIYEGIKARLQQMKDAAREGGPSNRRSAVDFFEFMGAGATSKTIASCIAYPHEVARTRLREHSARYRSFWQTLFLVGREEGLRGLYRGLCTQLVRQIPNTAIMMSTYEFVIYICTQHLYDDEEDEYDDEYDDFDDYDDDYEDDDDDD